MNIEQYIAKLYLKNEYLTKHPSLHLEDSHWKVSKIRPLIDELLTNHIRKKQINLLDVGGGAGLILKTVSDYIQREHHVTVNKFALDLSPAILKIQQRLNPDLVKTLNEDICETSLPDNSIDLALMIDVLEHIPKPRKALKELRRIAKFAIFKIPLEYNLVNRLANVVMHGRRWNQITAKSGHLNFYNVKRFEQQVEDMLGHIIRFDFTNFFQWCISHKRTYYKRMTLTLWLLDAILTFVSSWCPYASSCVNTDFLVVLIKCDLLG